MVFSLVLVLFASLFCTSGALADDSPLLHNSNRFGICRNSNGVEVPALSGTSEADCTAVPGNTWTASARWAPEGWGVAGGTYGEFVCATCHVRTTTNIKKIRSALSAPNGTDVFPGSSVVFMKTTDGSSDFGDDAEGHATSEKICEVCHSLPLYHRYDTTGQADLSHNNASDCISCHRHDKGFRASCTVCHGYPPVDNATLVAFTLPSSTGSATAGAHSMHVASRGIGCSVCHSGSAGSGPLHNNGELKVTIGFSAFDGLQQGGAYDGQATVLYDSSHAGTSVSAGGLRQCSSIYCHGTTMAPNGGTDITPVWSSPATGSCGTCHGASAANPPLRGSHLKHAGSSASLIAPVSCDTCHQDNSHVNNRIEWKFGPAGRVAGAQ